MRILRHSKIAVTMEIYTEASSEATREALRKLSDWLADCCCRLLLPEEDGRFPAGQPCWRWPAARSVDSTASVLSFLGTTGNTTGTSTPASR